ncbi:TPA: 50S ribosomal protein L30 [Pseudomonas aeruginosa]|nr:50S ribosomal protein L30 [Pseudomonas aeruginosa]
MATVKVTLVKSLNGRLANHKACVKGLGLRTTCCVWRVNPCN